MAGVFHLFNLLPKNMLHPQTFRISRLERAVLRTEITGVASYVEFKVKTFLCHRCGSLYTWHNSNQLNGN